VYSRGVQAVTIAIDSSSAPGCGVLAVHQVGGESRVTQARAHSPLHLLTPRVAGVGGRAAWVFVATFGGGLLPGDRLALDVTVGEAATALVGTQAQTKVFRAGAAGGATQRVRAEVAPGGLLVWLPDPVACFADARWEQTLELHLGEAGSAVLVEGVTAGRSARGERWAFARVAMRTRVWAPGLVLDDGLELDAAHGALPARLGRMGALATVTAFGPRAAPVAEALRAAGRAPLGPRGADIVLAVSEVGGGAAAGSGAAGVVARLAGVAVEPVLRAVRELLAGVTALVGDDPFARKW